MKDNRNSMIIMVMMMFLTDTLCMPRGQKKHMKRINAPHHWKRETNPELGSALHQQIQENNSILQVPIHKKHMAQQSHHDHQHNKIEHFVIQ